MTRRGRLGIASVGQEFYASLSQVNSDGCLGEQPLGRGVDSGRISL